jgi:hypothetical protein
MGQQHVDAVEPGKAFDIFRSERLETTSGPIVENACEQHIALAFRIVKRHSSVVGEIGLPGTQTGSGQVRGLSVLNSCKEDLTSI